MTEQEKNQRYSNMCLILGDHLMKAAQHDKEAKRLIIEIETFLIEQTTEGAKDGLEASKNIVS